ncbi:NAD-dependent epimerase/dehydratase family protein [Bordetella sp. BOR01]|uniref:NAD-dependent epimerase/dehydratase family protein n=1 Tax=Bordetella sp. BOR01 TaxID=2854779 RepID=UPI001C4775FB|nr:NAD-dependent epimerase/dehydratase family protein [Bordetella sp. BOR01]MBV7483956.1 NAD-dependent epimerase/dehydratase family protein [Bordetella sp. BOR01]
MLDTADRPVILITGASGNLGRSLAGYLETDYRIVGLDRKSKDAGFPVFEVDLSADASVRQALQTVRQEYGATLAAVIHLVAYFDSTGADNPLYRVVNVDGTARLLRELRDQFQVERFVYASTMLVHAPGKPGELIAEDQPFGPEYVYPQSKLQAEEVVRREHGDMPYAILRLAGVYDEQTVVPTLAQQIARIYERDLESYFYSASNQVGQSMLHRDDLHEAVRLTLEHRATLPADAEMLIGETEALGYDALQDEIGCLIHGTEDWPTLRVPKAVAATGTWMREKLEPLVPDALDQGEKPFIKPYMVAMSDAHYALDTARAEDWLGWRPRHRLKRSLPAIIANLKRDPLAWYRAQGMSPPQFLRDSAGQVDDAEQFRARQAQSYRSAHAENRWAHFLNIALGTWLICQPPLVGVQEPLLRGAEIGLGALLVIFAFLSLGWQMAFARWVCAGLGALIMAAPFVFWTTNGAAYLSDTLVGGLAFGLAVGLKPEPGVAPLARLTGPTTPPGWTYNPSDWTQRVPIIALALVGLYVSRYLAAYQMEQVGHVWEPFFAGSADDPRNGTEEIITSSVSRAWPVPDAAVGAYTYMLEILTGVVGSRARWRTMPWLVVIFGLMIAPLGIVSITFVIIQPIVIGTWSTLALIGAAAMLVQIPYSLDELLATCQFLQRRRKAGKSLLRVFLFGDTDEGARAEPVDEFDRRPTAVLRDIVQGGVSLPPTLWLAAAIGAWLMCTRLTLDTTGTMANADHLVGALVLTVVAIAAAEVARLARFLLVPLGVGLLVVTPVYGTSLLQIAANVAAGLALIGLAVPRGKILGTYGRWDRLVL